MPLYSYKCRCGKEFETFRKLAEYNLPQHCACGQVAEKKVVAPAVRGDLPAYECPVTGTLIEGRVAHEANLAKHGCRLWEPGETEQLRKRKAAEEEAFCERVAETAAQAVAAMPSEKQERLGQELASGADAVITRA